MDFFACLLIYSFEDGPSKSIGDEGEERMKLQGFANIRENFSCPSVGVALGKFKAKEKMRPHQMIGPQNPLGMRGGSKCEALMIFFLDIS
jgi:hypothetical protein